ncbi:SPOR domain-containing protein [Novosphingobium sp. EMRT-2]|uniref:SPOR domain-containing protein n=1 Tax=Novosphingobium sp. EMRT-2 TaxID=2571749 RepID=UPI002102BFDC|nr:SPOR domain-containing protein [Novosphingobium sp. EMRT-2]
MVKSGVDAWQRQDYAGAVRQWETAAAKGDADAEFNLGQAYRLGKGVPQDMAKAEFYFGRAARKGHPQAGDNYGIVLFQSGRQTEALPWLNTAADRGEPRAMYILGIAAFNGDYVGKDWVRAYALMTRAAASGLPQATSSLATMDTVIPLEQRQMGISLAGDLERKAEQARSVQLAASDLGAKAPPVQTPANAAPRPLPTISVPASTVAAAPPPPAPPRPATPRPATPRPAPPPPAQHTPPTVRATGNWRIQLGAFSQRGNADALWSRVKARPGLAGHPRIDIPSGGVTRLLAGGYGGQADAERACDGLKAGGIACLVIKP